MHIVIFSQQIFWFILVSRYKTFLSIWISSLKLYYDEIKLNGRNLLRKSKWSEIFVKRKSKSYSIQNFSVNLDFLCYIKNLTSSYLLRKKNYMNEKKIWLKNLLRKKKLPLFPSTKTLLWGNQIKREKFVAEIKMIRNIC